MDVAEITLEQAQVVVNAHREREYAKRAEEARKLVGQFFRFRNSYGGVDETEKWWLYAMPTDVSEYGHVTGLTFQRTSTGKVEVELRGSISIESGGWREISASKFWAEAAAIRGDVIARLSPPEA